jgi:hypothetical protein
LMRQAKFLEQQRDLRGIGRRVIVEADHGGALQREDELSMLTGTSETLAQSVNLMRSRAAHAVLDESKKVPAAQTFAANVSDCIRSSISRPISIRTCYL